MMVRIPNSRETRCLEKEDKAKQEELFLEKHWLNYSFLHLEKISEQISYS